MSNIKAISLEMIWQDMQQKYSAMYQVFGAQDNSPYVLDFWKNQKINFSSLINGAPRVDFLQTDCILKTMFRGGFGQMQRYELSYLKNCLSEDTKKIISQVAESSFGGTQVNQCIEYRCSWNMLGQLFYLAKLIENSDFESLRMITDFGGGYGALAYATKQIKKDITYIIIDLPEILAIQYAYLKGVLPNEKIFIHNQVAPLEYDNAIHLIPIYLFPEQNITADAFISTFALSEAPPFTQNLIIQKKFFDARYLYIVGQMAATNSVENWADGSSIIENVRRQYAGVTCQPFHFYNEGFPIYEIIGSNLN